MESISKCIPPEKLASRRRVFNYPLLISPSRGAVFTFKSFAALRSVDIHSSIQYPHMAYGLSAESMNHVDKL